MIMVTGSARTGTSLMMQTLIKLGYEPLASAFIKEHNDIRGYNPKGFYDLDLEGVENINKKDKGKAVKIFPSCFDIIDFELVEKVIVMNRDKDDSVNSYKPILEKFGIEKELASDIYDQSYEYISSINSEIPIIFVNFEDILLNPKKSVNSLIKFLGGVYKRDMVADSINNIKTR